MSERTMRYDPCAYTYSRHLLEQLLRMELISKEEFDRIDRLNAAYYGVKRFCV